MKFIPLQLEHQASPQADKVPPQVLVAQKHIEHINEVVTDPQPIQAENGGIAPEGRILTNQENAAYHAALGVLSRYFLGEVYLGDDDDDEKRWIRQPIHSGVFVHMMPDGRMQLRELVYEDAKLCVQDDRSDAVFPIAEYTGGQWFYVPPPND